MIERARPFLALLLVYGGALLGVFATVVPGRTAIVLWVSAAILFLARLWLALQSGAKSRSGCGRSADLPVDPGVWPPVSVLIPAWQEAGTLPLCISSLRAQDYPDWEAIIVAGGADGTLEEACAISSHDSRFQVIPQLPGGKNAALNAGLERAHGDVIVLLDADSQFGPTWLRELVRPLSTSIAATTGNSLPLRRTWLTSYEQMERTAWYRVACMNTLQGSSGIALRRETIQALDRFDEGAVADDWELDLQLGAHGLTSEYCHSAMVYTERPATIGEWSHNEVRWMRAHFTSIKRNRRFFQQNIMRALTNVYAYLRVLIVLGLVLSLLVATVSHVSGIQHELLIMLILFLAAGVYQDMMSVIAVTVHTKQLSWLRMLGAAPVISLARLAATGLAMLTVGKATLHFKGPRHRVHADLIEADEQRSNERA